MSGKRIYGLDILRAIAIMSVLIGHSGNLMPKYLTDFIYRWDIEGVTIFFVLSGFLIGGILLRRVNEGDFNLFNFWSRRWLRTLPAFYVTTGLLIICYYFTNQLPPTLFIIKTLTFTQSIYYETTRFYEEGWSLAVEEWFYLFIPLLMFVFHKIFTAGWRRVFLVTIITIIIFSTALRVYRLTQFNYLDMLLWENNIRRPLLFRLDSLMYGVLAAYMYYYKLRIWEHKNLLFTVGILLFCVVGLYSYSNVVYAYFSLSLSSIGTLCVLPKLNSITVGRGIIFRAVTFISTISYSLYLLNLAPFRKVVLPIIRNFCPGYSSMCDLVCLVGFYLWAFVGAWFMYTFVERPFMEMRNTIPKLTYAKV